MVDSIHEMIRASFGYEDAVKCIFGLNSLDLETYKTLLLHGPITTEGLGKIVKREKSTVYRSLQNLIACGIAYRKKRSIEGGGYYYEYISVESGKVKKVLKKNIDDWYYQMNELIEKNEF
jgi:predicted transcriptional regulator